MVFPLPCEFDSNRINEFATQLDTIGDQIGHAMFHC